MTESTSGNTSGNTSETKHRAGLFDIRFIIAALVGLYGVVLVLTGIFDSGSLVENIISGLAAGGFFLVAAIVYPAGMGIGDVKLAAVMGLVLGRAVIPAIRANRCGSTAASRAGRATTGCGPRTAKPTMAGSRR